ncbi:conserved hypothetical protein [Verticillium alfalfae VaMs.102]|uniref:Uncharacterized protein n=1 Tax=Verticillium alfalfae (strain VaMs.102 / ATCC MYA-4576 / FGSC 10136) TaxID=526221 RepID=C9S7F8_VERA1|nr:conserved hypothetical protein [Verticillium alfalfae VaMs.102]EEY14719.1 conserved hypothetical protein [Verticillium alfalfae VaMs.102]
MRPDGSVVPRTRLLPRASKTATAKSMKLARDRVNCVTLWFPQDMAPPTPDRYNEPVAVLANNDKTVVVISLHDFEAKDKTEPLDMVTYPDYVNRSLLSPDGRLLIAILDDPYLYIHRRVEKHDDQTAAGDTNATAYQWEEARKVLLKSQRKGDLSDSRGSFAACFFPLGRVSGRRHAVRAPSSIFRRRDFDRSRRSTRC